MLIKYYLVETERIDSPGSHPSGLAYDQLYDLLYYSDGDSNAIYRLEADGEWTEVIRLKDVRADLAFDGRNLWQITGPNSYPRKKRKRHLVQVLIDRTGPSPRYKQGKVINLEEGFEASGLDFKGNLAYVFGDLGTVVVDVNTELSHLPFLPALEDSGGIVLFDSEMWVADFRSSEIARIDSNRDIVDRMKICDTPTGITCSGNNLWVNNYRDRVIVKYDVRY